MTYEAEFEALFRSFIEQYRLSPEIAGLILKKILQILSENAETDDPASSQKEEREEKDT